MQADRPASLLVIEDDAFMAALLTFLFEREQMRVHCLADGRAALEQLAHAPEVDAVVLDLMLPQASGMEVLARLREQPLWAEVPVLVLSALDGGAEEAQALRAGANDYLSKPFDPQVLSARLARLLPRVSAGGDRV